MVILTYAHENNGISLKDLKENMNEDYSELIPNVEIFKEIVIELLRNADIDIEELKKERSEHIVETSTLEFQLNESILDLIDINHNLENIKKISTYRIGDEEPVVFENVSSSTGKIKRIYCSNIYFDLN